LRGVGPRKQHIRLESLVCLGVRETLAQSHRSETAVCHESEEVCRERLALVWLNERHLALEDGGLPEYPLATLQHMPFVALDVQLHGDDPFQKTVLIGQVVQSTERHRLRTANIDGGIASECVAVMGRIELLTKSPATLIDISPSDDPSAAFTRCHSESPPVLSASAE